MRAHAESINLTLCSELDELDAKELLSKAAGLKIIDDRANNRFPTSPLKRQTKRRFACCWPVVVDISQPGKLG